MKNTLLLLAGLLIANQALATDPPQYGHLARQASANNQFGLKFYQSVHEGVLAETGTYQNTLVSPISAYAAFSMLNTGLRGPTRSSLQDAMAINPIDHASLDKLNGELFGALSAETTATGTTAPGERKKAIVGIYNSVWANNGATNGEQFVFAPAYLSRLAPYKAEVQSLDFTKELATKTVNAWANDKTRGMIPTVISSDVMKELKWILMNASYLEAQWQYGFKKKPAREATPFQTLAGGTEAVDTIVSAAHYQTASTADVDMIEVPFYGSDLAFYAIQPKSIALFSEMMKDGRLANPALWAQLTAKLKLDGESKIALEMPKFSFSDKHTMKSSSPLTTRLGLNFLFDGRNGKDFSPMGSIVLPDGSKAETVVGLVKQDTKIELDENGVKAAAVTLIGGVRSTSIPRPVPIVPFIIDKPFQFVIASRATGAILFVGTIVNPK